MKNYYAAIFPESKNGNTFYVVSTNYYSTPLSSIKRGMLNDPTVDDEMQEYDFPLYKCYYNRGTGVFDVEVVPFTALYDAPADGDIPTTMSANNTATREYMTTVTTKFFTVLELRNPNVSTKLSKFTLHESTEEVNTRVDVHTFTVKLFDHLDREDAVYKTSHKSFTCAHHLTDCIVLDSIDYQHKSTYGTLWNVNPRVYYPNQFRHSIYDVKDFFEHIDTSIQSINTNLKQSDADQAFKRLQNELAAREVQCFLDLVSTGEDCYFLITLSDTSPQSKINVMNAILTADINHDFQITTFTKPLPDDGSELIVSSVEI